MQVCTIDTSGRCTVSTQQLEKVSSATRVVLHSSADTTVLLLLMCHPPQVISQQSYYYWEASSPMLQVRIRHLPLQQYRGRCWCRSSTFWRTHVFLTLAVPQLRYYPINIVGGNIYIIMLFATSIFRQIPKTWHCASVAPLVFSRSGFGWGIELLR